MPRRVEGVTELVMDGIKKRMHPIPVSILAPVKSSASNSGSPRSSGTSGNNSSFVDVTGLYYVKLW